MDINQTPSQIGPKKPRKYRVAEDSLVENIDREMRWFDFPNPTVQTPELRAAAVARLKELFEESDWHCGRKPPPEVKP